MLDKDRFDFTFSFTGVHVKTDKRGEYLTVYIPQENDRDDFYTISLDDWEADAIIKLLRRLMDMPAQEIQAAFVYDDIAEVGIFDAITLAQSGQIGWVQKGRNEGYEYVKPTELGSFLLEKGAFDDVSPMILDCVDTEALSAKLIDGDVLYLLEDDIAGFTERIHRYESGCYYDCGKRILDKID